jgi:homoserine dehydrogenase
VLTDDPLAVANDPSIHIVCELMGGTDARPQVTLAALRRGKSRGVGQQGAHLRARRPRSSRPPASTAAISSSRRQVAGGIPIIKALREGLVANRFPRIYGILNGTCNYILTQMEDQDAPVRRACSPRPSAWVTPRPTRRSTSTGWDTAHKASVLAWLAHGVWVKTDQMIVEGIDRITPGDFKNAATLGFGIKLLASSRAISRRTNSPSACTRRCCPRAM